MNRAARFAAAVLLAHAGLAAAQAGGHHRSAVPQTGAQTTKQQEAGKKESRTPPGPVVYDSAFDAYRPFIVQEPAKSWRSANDEVRDAGGHVGTTKATEAAKGSKP